MKKTKKRIKCNQYQVEAQFQKARFFYRTEIWQGSARNMVIAMRRAAKDILRRPNVKRLRHLQVTFRIEKLS